MVVRAELGDGPGLFPDVGHAVKVVGRDVYGLDREGDGSGCESYGP